VEYGWNKENTFIILLHWMMVYGKKNWKHIHVHVYCGNLDGEVEHLHKHWCYSSFYSLALIQYFASSTVVITIWFANTNPYWVECCLMCFITFLRPFWPTDFDYELLRLPDLEIELTAGVTGQRWVLTFPKHLIPPLVCPRVLQDLYFIRDLWH
jgi:hypothetical protein